MKMQRILREDHEKIVKLKGMTPDNKIPMGLLLDKSKFHSGKTHLYSSSNTFLAQDKFKRAREADGVNERIPQNYK